MRKLWAIIEDGKIVFGPRGWNQKVFMAYAKRRGLPDTFTLLEPNGMQKLSAGRLIPAYVPNTPAETMYETPKGPIWTIGEERMDGTFEMVSRYTYQIKYDIVKEFQQQMEDYLDYGITYNFPDQTRVRVSLSKAEREKYNSLLETDQDSYEVTDVKGANHTLDKKQFSDFMVEVEAYTEKAQEAVDAIDLEVHGMENPIPPDITIEDKISELAT